MFQEISNRTHVSRTPKKPEYLIARSQLTERGPLGIGPIQFLMDMLVFVAIIFRWKMPNIRQNNPREPQVLMSGIEVDGWQLFLKEVWGLPGGRVSCGGTKITLIWIYVKTQPCFFFWGEILRDLGVCNINFSPSLQNSLVLLNFPTKKNRSGVVVTLTVEKSPNLTCLVQLPLPKLWPPLLHLWSRLTNNQAQKPLGQLSRGLDFWSNFWP